MQTQEIQIQPTLTTSSPKSYQRKRCPGKLPKVLPSVPIRQLWELASQEERSQAQKTSALILEYWQGRITKLAAAQSLAIKPIRFWQLSTQAILGMNVGLLVNPKKYSEEFMKDKKMIKDLTKKTVKLEKQIELQKRMIDVIRILPGKKAGGKIKDGSFQRAQAERRSKPKKPALRQAEDNSQGTVGNQSNPSQLEESKKV